ncbi:MAG: MmcQ/YjbR family DNA-binding protein [Planctomycetota bacterium]|nr:MmcQ/YjbR family DNA-binding protein [Planctomycetota bacterium]
MRLATIRDHLLAMPGSVESQPFGPDVLVFKVANKMFALVGWKNDPLTINLKADPDDAVLQRERHAAINPGYHMSKVHWNTVTLDKSLADDDVFELVQASYDLILGSLTKKARADFDARMDA